jgi:nucleotide-binding universal stress UspA family protein
MARTTVKIRKTAPASSRILVATDFSSHAVHAAEVGSRLARALGAEVVLMHADEPLIELTHSNAHMRRRRMDIAELERAAKALRARGVPARSLFRVGKPAREIVDAAAEEDAAMVVMGTRGRTAAVGALLGGVAYEVIRKASCPVLTVRGPVAARLWPPGRVAAESRAPRRGASAGKRAQATRPARRH